MSPSTRAMPSRRVNWLFFNPVNTRSEVHCMTIPGYPLDTRVGELEWAAALKKYFNFRAGCLIHLWRPKGTLLTEEIKHDWVHTADKIENIAGICQYISTVRRAFGKSLESSERVHLLIEAEEDKGDEDLETGSYPNAIFWTYTRNG